MDNEYITVKKWYDDNVDLYTSKSALLLHDQLSYFISKLPSGGKILDIGCGPGHDTEYFSKKGFDAIGVDFSSKMIQFSKNTRKFGEFKKIDILDLDKYFTANCFNGIWSSSSITHLKKNDIVKALKQIKRIVLPKSPVVIIVKKRTKRKLRKNKILFNEFYKKDIQEYCKKSGLFIKSFQTFKALNMEWFFIHTEKR